MVTEEFLEDQGVTNVEDLFLYTTNTEVSGQEVISEQVEQTAAIQMGEPVFADWLSLIGLGTSF